MKGRRSSFETGMITLKRNVTELWGAVVLNLFDIVRSSFNERIDDAEGGGISSIDSISHDEETDDAC